MSVLSYELHPTPSALLTSELDALVITYVRASGGEYLPLSHYGQMVWDYTPYVPHAARPNTDKKILWDKTPSEWVESMKGAISAFTFRKPPDGLRLDPATIPKRAITLNAFAKWCSAARIKKFQDVRAFDLARYVQKLRDDGLTGRSLQSHLTLLRKVYEMRMFMADSFTSDAISAIGFEQFGPLWDADFDRERRTAVIPLDEATILFSAALEHLENAELLLALRDDLDADWLAANATISRKRWGDTVKFARVRERGFRDVNDFESAVGDIRTAAYIVLAQSTGCRVHELGDARVGCVYSEEIDGDTYWWLKSTTRKIGNGPQRWLAPQIAYRVIKILEWHSAPLRQEIAAELARVKTESAISMSASDGAKFAAYIIDLERNVDRLFLSKFSNRIGSTDTKAHNKQLRAFAQRRNLRFKLPLATHRFRRTYAVIVVNLNKGARIDLLTLQHHFKHASILMAEWYAELSETDKELLDLIDVETNYFDLALIDHWMESSTPLAGGFGARIKSYPGRHHQPIFFKTRREFIESIRDDMNIRSTGHSWCLADGEDCGGRGLFEPPRCGDCANGVVDDHFSDVWENLRTQQAELTKMDDIGPGGREKAKRTLAAAESVLAQLVPVEKEAFDD